MNNKNDRLKSYKNLEEILKKVDHNFTMHNYNKVTNLLFMSFNYFEIETL